MTKARDIADGTRYVDVTGDTMSGNLKVQVFGNATSSVQYGTGLEAKLNAYAGETALELPSPSTLFKVRGKAGAIDTMTLGATYSGTEREGIVLDYLGRVTTPYNPAFVAFMSANHTTTMNGQLPFDSLSTEIPSQRSTGYSTANRRFTAPVTGLYQFSVSLDFAGNYSNYYFWCGINGGGRYRDFLENVDILANGGFYSTFSIHMTAGDYIQLHSGVTGINLFGGNAAWNCVWQGYLIG